MAFILLASSCLSYEWVGVGKRLNFMNNALFIYSFIQQLFIEQLLGLRDMMMNRDMTMTFLPSWRCIPMEIRSLKTVEVKVLGTDWVCGWGVLGGEEDQK